LGLLTAASARKELGWRAIAFLPVAATVHLVYGSGLWCGFLKDLVFGASEVTRADNGAGQAARNQA
jgi:hypothetical protein